MARSTSPRLCYIDTSVIIKRMFDEADSIETRRQFEVARLEGFVFVASQLAELELSRFLHSKTGPEFTPHSRQARKQHALLGIQLVKLDSLTMKKAALFPFQHLGSLDSIHLSTAQIMRATHFLTRDRQLLRACDEVGIKTTFS